MSAPVRTPDAGPTQSQSQAPEAVVDDIEDPLDDSYNKYDNLARTGWSRWRPSPNP